MRELAPRDVVSRAIVAEMQRTGSPHVWLDLTARGSQFIHERFPRIFETCQRYGLDLGREPAPVHPAAHYAMGGVEADLDGRTSLPGLFAAGEVACTGVHGASRLASNSLLEGLVYAERIAAALPGDLARDAPAPSGAAGASTLLDPAVRPEIQRIMPAGSGVLRAGPGLDRAAAGLAALAGRTTDRPCTEAWEATTLHTVASLIVASAREREETRGSHWRSDFPDAVEDWRGHLVSTLSRETLTTTFRHDDRSDR